MSKKTQPLYESVDKDRFTHLLECEKIVDTIGIENAELIAGAVVYSRTKHPNFAQTFTNIELDKCLLMLDKVRHVNSLQENCGDEDVYNVMQEEILEATEQHLLGCTERCITELSQVAAVAINAMDFERRLE